ncbi:class I SAM-dependent methyltransferase [Brevibacillus dissolubilis]|uniref:class I SAM-dependent methyltransferase n=1 Tax=Brevibacillus dissolubilis TaxID=1844116 RepID=UPI0011167A86|nr:methyltransferase domain-containing protein [Brevibacillus dissolubilis]
MDPIERIKQANELLAQNQLESAKPIYQELVGQNPIVDALAYYHLGQIANRQKDPLLSQDCHLRAFQAYPKLAEILVAPNHPSHPYVFTHPEETNVVHCPLCGTEGKPYACYNTVTGIDFIPGFNPVRLWMHCDNCHHLFANNYPFNLGELLAGTAFEFNLNPRTQRFSVLSTIISNLKRLAPGNKLLEVGVGAGEFSAVAKEFLFDVTGLDIRPAYAEAVSNMLEIPVHCADFQHVEGEAEFDVICMGDVIEHMADPVSALKKAHSLLVPNGVLWVSTPNFESAFSYVKKESDPMWLVVEHLNYFSFVSLRKTLEECGFEVVNYQVSSHYNGSMEVTAVKK